MIRGLYLLVLTEAVLGGGGRFFPVGPVTLRMLLFATCLGVWLLAFGYRKRPEGQWLAFLLVYSFIGSLLFGLLVDATSGASWSRIAAEIQPLLFWLTAPFVAMAIDSPAMVKRSAQIIMYGGCLVACVILAITGALAVGLLPLAQFYTWSLNSGELFFRSDISFFYKGLFYVAVALVFTVVLKPRLWLVMSAILAFAIAASLTRGLMLASVLTVIFALMSARRHGTVLILVLIGTAISGLYGQDLIEVLFRDSSRASSSSVRAADMLSFWEGFDGATLFFGDGAGTLLNGRQGVENSYLWAIWRFGIVGLAFWLSPVIISFHYYRKIRRHSPFHKIASAFFYGMVMLSMQTAFNPFLNNSIGISYALLAVFSLRRLGRKQVETAEISTVRVPA
jgi:hypothetical protein